MIDSSLLLCFLSLIITCTLKKRQEHEKTEKEGMGKGLAVKQVRKRSIQQHNYRTSITRRRKLQKESTCEWKQHFLC